MLLRERPWDRNLQLLLVTIVFFNLLPHLLQVPLWVSALAGLAITWKLLYLLRGYSLPGRALVSMFAVIATISVFFNSGTIASSDASRSLLVLMASLKLLETNRYRDTMLILFTCYFLLMTYLVETQSLAATIFTFVDLVVLTGLLLQIHLRGQPRTVRPALKLLITVLPIWGFLFIVFPRFSSSLWGLTRNRAVGGFSDELDPGSIAGMVDSDEVAFRVEFPKALPLSVPAQSIYYRGAILSIGDGLKWHRAQQTTRPDIVLNLPSSLATFETQIWLEPGYDRWLFTPDTGLSLTIAKAQEAKHIGVRKKSGFTFSLDQPNYSHIAYVTRSSVEPPWQRVSPPELAILRLLPTNLGAKTEQLAQDLLKNASAKKNGAELELREAATVLEWFDREKFHYTKSPGRLTSVSGVDQLEEFLFVRRNGFCEHFAAAFATLMRSMGTPARVVVGFQGGTFSRFLSHSLGRYWILRKMDAHAWVEIWLPRANEPSVGRWQRIDPTATIAPLRLELGGDFNRLDASTLAAGLSGDEIRQRLDQGFDGWFEQLQSAWDVMQMRFNAFMLVYDLDFQKQLLDSWLNRIGLQMPTHGKWLVATLLGIGLVGSLLIVMITGSAFRRYFRTRDPLLTAWRIFCRRCEKAGLEAKAMHEGPLTFAARASKKFPEAAAQITALANAYNGCRYGASTQLSAGQVAQALKRFSIEKSSFLARSRFSKEAK